MVDHTERAHAPFSPSGAERWLKCPASIPLTQDLPDTSGPDAAAGTICHEIAEPAITERWTPEQIQRALVKAKLDVAVLSLAEATTTVIEYQRYVLDRYDALVMLWGEENVTLLVEAKVTIDGSECFGTLDAALIWPEGVEVIDLKTGAGHAVDCDKNEQMLTYALGLHKGGKLSHLKHDSELIITVVQPRRRDGAPPVDSWCGHVSEISLHAISVAGAISNARGSNPRYEAGDHCRWCKAKGKCKVQSDEVVKAFDIIESKTGPITETTKVNVDLLTPHQIGRFLTMLPTLKQVIKSIEKRALAEPPPGWKLVQGKSNRKWVDGAEVVLASKLDASSVPLFFTSQPIGITDAVKVLKTLGMSQMESDLFFKPEGKPTLAPESDKRPAVTSTDGLDMIEDD